MSAMSPIHQIWLIGKHIFYVFGGNVVEPVASAPSTTEARAMVAGLAKYHRLEQQVYVMDVNLGTMIREVIQL
jgi:hypothetical protein